MTGTIKHYICVAVIVIMFAASFLFGVLMGISIGKDIERNEQNAAEMTVENVNFYCQNSKVLAK